MKMGSEKTGTVLAVSKSSSHTFNKYREDKIVLIKGLGVEGDAHAGKTVKHRSRVRKDPSQPNLRQVHLMHAELFDELYEKGFTVQAAQMGENITTSGIDLLALPENTVLEIGKDAIIRVTGLRNPCNQINGIQDGLMQALLDKDADGNLIRKAGIMAVVEKGGSIEPGDAINVIYPAIPHRPLGPV